MNKAIFMDSDWVTVKNGEKWCGDRNLSALAGELRELPYGRIFLNWRDDLWEVTTAAANAWIIPYESHWLLIWKFWFANWVSFKVWNQINEIWVRAFGEWFFSFLFFFLMLNHIKFWVTFLNIKNSYHSLKKLLHSVIFKYSTFIFPFFSPHFSSVSSSLLFVWFLFICIW